MGSNKQGSLSHSWQTVARETAARRAFPLKNYVNASVISLSTTAPHSAAWLRRWEFRSLRFIATSRSSD